MQPRDLEDVEVDEDMELDDELCRDIQMKLPDCLWQLDYVGRYAAGKFNEDFASLDSGERFLFGVIRKKREASPGASGRKSLPRITMLICCPSRAKWPRAV